MSSESGRVCVTDVTRPAEEIRAPYDQIPPERRTIADYTGRLGDQGHNGVLCVALAQWMARDDHSLARRTLGSGGFTFRYFRPASTSA